MEAITWACIRRRNDEPTIAYLECHDHSIMMNKTFAFWLMDSEVGTLIVVVAVVVAAVVGLFLVRTC
jgi:hypothetical protein